METILWIAWCFLLVVLIIGFLSLIKPISSLGIRSRGAAARAFVIGLLGVVGVSIPLSAMLPDQARQSSQAASPSPIRTTVQRSQPLKVARVVATPALASAQPPPSLMPQQERAFVSASTQTREIFNGAGNDMAKGGARAERKGLICAALSSLQVSDWHGKVYSLSSNGEGKGVIELLIGPNIYVKTWNNALSDIGDDTLIDPASSVFQNAVALKAGEAVAFSGSFLQSDVDCVREGSMTLEGSMTEPEFIFRFSDIRPAAQAP